MTSDPDGAFIAWQAWSVNRYAMVARKHGLYHTCINIINSMYGFNAMEVQEAFTKIKEQVCDIIPWIGSSGLRFVFP